MKETKFSQVEPGPLKNIKLLNRTYRSYQYDSVRGSSSFNDSKGKAQAGYAGRKVVQVRTHNEKKELCGRHIYEYNEDGKLISETDSADIVNMMSKPNGELSFHYRKNYTYTDTGVLIEEIPHDPSMLSSLEYIDLSGKIQLISYIDDSTTLYYEAYDYFEDGVLLAISQVRQGEEEELRAYSYDEKGLPTQMNYIYRGQEGIVYYFYEYW